MENKGRIKSLLPGGNTSLGFFSYFQYVIDLKKANKVYYLKGGPGTGKSSMMKKIGDTLINKGYDIEFHHCSADPDSIDALVVPKLKIAMLDGTAPHVLDPKYPGAVDTTIHLGDYWQEENLRNNRESIIDAIDENGKIYKRVYKFLGAAKLIHDDIEWTYNQAMDFLKINEATSKIIEKFFGSLVLQKALAYERHLFGSAYTHKGHIDFAETYFAVIRNIYYIKGAPGTGKSTLLENIAKTATEKGYDIEVYHEPLVPDKVESVIIPQLDMAFTTNSKYQDHEIINLNKFIQEEKRNKYKQELEYSEKLFQQLIDDVTYNLQRTKKNHDYIEDYYVPNIQFEKIDALREKLLEEILTFGE
ncbi:ATpase [Clostridium aceticum]|uniref:ATpase n=1 Tax=Clostridium aceticum TaxID=84022 RepID=A0A0D8I5Y8_9CLOT|nr:PRK06851 family protein [Clostridium aceticum]AKL95850.1 ATpase [Clostridium aceticum]KJF25464.1 ATPase [Clostridium aceticum]